MARSTTPLLRTAYRLMVCLTMLWASWEARVHYDEFHWRQTTKELIKRWDVTLAGAVSLEQHWSLTLLGTVVGLDTRRLFKRCRTISMQSLRTR